MCRSRRAGQLHARKRHAGVGEQEEDWCPQRAAAVEAAAAAAAAVPHLQASPLPLLNCDRLSDTLGLCSSLRGLVDVRSAKVRMAAARCEFRAAVRGNQTLRQGILCVQTAWVG